MHKFFGVLDNPHPSWKQLTSIFTYSCKLRLNTWINIAVMNYRISSSLLKAVTRIALNTMWKRTTQKRCCKTLVEVYAWPNHELCVGREQWDRGNKTRSYGGASEVLMYQILLNTIKQGVQTGKCLIIRQCLIAFDRQTFSVWTGNLKTRDACN